MLKSIRKKHTNHVCSRLLSLRKNLLFSSTNGVIRTCGRDECLQVMVVVGELTGKKERQFAQLYNFYDGEKSESMGLSQTRLFSCIDLTSKFFWLMMNTMDNLSPETTHLHFMEQKEIHYM